MADQSVVRVTLKAGMSATLDGNKVQVKDQDGTVCADIEGGEKCSVVLFGVSLPAKAVPAAAAPKDSADKPPAGVPTDKNLRRKFLQDRFANGYKPREKLLGEYKDEPWVKIGPRPRQLKDRPPWEAQWKKALAQE